MKKLLAIALLLGATPAFAQNPQCPTRPAGDATNACASTAFVQNALVTPPLTHTHIFVGNGGGVSADYGTLATFSDTGTFTLNPTTGYSLGYNITQTGTTGGTPPAQTGTFLGYAYNRILVNNRTATAYTDSVYGLHVELDSAVAGTGGANAAGFFHTISSPASGGATFAIGSTHYVSAETNWAGGTLISPNGAVYGISVYARMGGPNVLHIANLTGMEINPEARGVAGSTLAYKSGIQIATLANDRLQGDNFDAALSISNIFDPAGLAPGWKSGILFSVANGQQPMAATGTLLQTIGAATVGSGIDISSYTITTAAFKSTNFIVDGTGQVSAFRYNNITLTTPASPATLTIITGTTVTGPATSDTLVGRATTDTLTNKSISGSTNTLTNIATTSLTGTLQAAQEPAHTGDVTNSAGSLALTIANNAVTLAKLATQATNTVLGNATSGTAVPTALAMTSCSTASSAVIWTTNTGFGCNTSITASSVAVGGITGLGTGVATALAVNIGSAGAFVTFNGALGTPSSGTVTNLTGTASININGTVGATTPAAGTFTTLIGTGGTHTGITSLSIRDTSAAFDVTIAATSSAALSAGRILTLNMSNVAHTLAFGSTANTITFPSAASYTVAGLSIAQTFSAKQTVNGVADDAMAILSGTAGVNAGLSVGRTTVDGYLVAIGGSAQYNPATLAGDMILRAQSRLVLDGSGGVTAGIIISSTNTVTLSTVASDTATVDNTLCVSSTGLVLKGSGALGVCLGTSGRQFKTAFAPMTAGLDEIAGMKLWNYRYRNGFGDSGEHKQYGSTAQDVAEIIPDLVRYDAQGEAINYDSGALLFISLHAIQQLKADNDNLQAQVVELRNRK